MVGLIALAVFILLGVVALWVRGIDEMHEKHPDYKGEDLFGEESKLQCKDCNDNLTDCTCIEDTIDMKQETLEEAAFTAGEEAFKGFKKAISEANRFDYVCGFTRGAKWQQEKMYSEEEVEDLIYKVCGTVARLQGITLNGNHIDTAYKQFKKK